MNLKEEIIESRLEDGTRITKIKKNIPIWITVWALLLGAWSLLMVDIDVEVKAKIKPPSIKELLK